LGERESNDTVSRNAKHIAIMTEKMVNISERIVEMAGSYKALEKSYVTLNECHHDLEGRMMKIETEWAFTKKLVGWILGGSAASLILNVITLAKLFGVM
jgi:hypothetical protein